MLYCLGVWQKIVFKSLYILIHVVAKQVRYRKRIKKYFHQKAAMARTSTKSKTTNYSSVLASLPRQSHHQEILPYLQRIFDSSRALWDSHESVNARYGRDFSGRLFIPQPDYKNLLGWFRIAFRKKDVTVTNQIKNSIVHNCMLFIRNGMLHDEKAVSGFVYSQEWHRRYALSPDKLREVVLRILIAEGIVNGVHASTPISGRGESETVPVTGRSTLPVTGVDGGYHCKSFLVPVTGQ